MRSLRRSAYAENSKEMVFVEGYERDTGRKHTPAGRRISLRIEAIDAKGLYFSPGVARPPGRSG